MVFRPVMLAAALFVSSTLCCLAQSDNSGPVMNFLKNGFGSGSEKQSSGSSDSDALSFLKHGFRSETEKQLAEQCADFFEGRTSDDRCSCRPHDIACGHCSKVIHLCTWDQ
jgi:hypothetical protein